MKKNKLPTLFSLTILINLAGCVGGNSTSSATSASSLNTAVNSTGTGQNVTKILNGQVVTDPAINARVPLIYTVESENNGGVCTGTLLSNDTVLTAAHCVLNMVNKPAGQSYTVNNLNDKSSMMIVLPKDLTSAIDLNPDSPETKSDWNIYSVKTIYVHSDALEGVDIENGNMNVVDQSEVNDLAIIKLSSPVDAEYQFVKVATRNPETGTKEIIAGFGYDQGTELVGTASDGGSLGVLRMAETIVDNITAGGAYIYMGGTPSPQGGYTKICVGDSGGPDLIQNSDGSYTITGVHSIGDGLKCGLPDSPALSISTAFYASWINGGYQTEHI